MSTSVVAIITLTLLTKTSRVSFFPLIGTPGRSRVPGVPSHRDGHLLRKREKTWNKMRRIANRPLRLVFRPLKMEGRVVDATGQPLAGVKISFMKRLIAQSDRRGRFVFVVYDPVEMAVITFEAAGHFPLTRCWRREEFDGKRATVVLPAANHEVGFDSAMPQRLKLGSLRLRLRPNSLLHADGSRHSGQARLQVAWNPADLGFPSSDCKVMVAFQVQVTDPEGAHLHCDPDEPGAMTLAWEGEMGMQLYHLDSGECKWVLVAEAEDVGAGETKALRMSVQTGSYILTQPDKPWVRVDAQVLDAQTRQPVAGISVWARSGKVDQRRHTDHQGQVRLLCPPDGNLVIDAHGKSAGHHYLMATPVTFQSHHHLAHCGPGPLMRPPHPVVELEVRCHRLMGDWLDWRHAALPQ